MPSEFFIPDLPRLDMPNNPSQHADWGFGAVTDMLKGIGNLPKLTDTLVPRVEGILGQQSQFLLPQIAGLRELTAGNVANAQSDATARGMRGSDIEAAGMLGARLGGQQAESQMRGQFGIASSQTLVDVLTRAMSGDIQAATNLRQMLAEAMGQQIAGERDLYLNREAMSNANAQAERNRMFALIGAGMGAAGSVAGGGLAGRGK